MTWPSGAVVTTNVDAGTDNPQTARADLLDGLQKLNQIIAHVSSFVQTLLDDADATAALATLGSAPLASPTFTGTPAAPTAAVDTNTTQLATTGYVVGQGYAKLASPTFTGNPLAPTPAGGDSDTSIATTAFVQGEIAPKAPLASPVFTGTPLETIGTGSGTAALIGKAFVNTTVVGNIGVGTDDLMSYSLLANSLSVNGKGLRITGWGRSANNANAKSILFNFGSFNVSLPMTSSIAGAWHWVVLIWRTASNAQDISYKISETVHNVGLAAPKEAQNGGTTAAETDTSAITIKFQGIGVADNDVTQEGMLVEYVG